MVCPSSSLSNLHFLLNVSRSFFFNTQIFFCCVLLLFQALPSPFSTSWYWNWIIFQYQLKRNVRLLFTFIKTLIYISFSSECIPSNSNYFTVYMLLIFVRRSYLIFLLMLQAA
jgi:hypothetical protein